MNNRELSQIFKDTLTLRWSPVAVKMQKHGEPIPEGLGEPQEPLRFCQSIVAARRGMSLYMPARRHGCPDGSGILGIVEMSEKLRSGALYLLFKKMPDIETAQKMIAARPEFPPGTYEASIVAPLEKANFEPDVVIFTIKPEQAMWLAASSSYSGFGNQTYRTSSYNPICAYLTVETMQTKELNMCFGCYGSRASTEIDDSELYMSVPYERLEVMAKALQKLAQKSIPEERAKIYLYPQMGQTEEPGTECAPVTEIHTDFDKCVGCGLCEAFCPHSLISIVEIDGARKAKGENPELCSACYTCIGQCPQHALRLIRG